MLDPHAIKWTNCDLAEGTSLLKKCLNQMMHDMEEELHKLAFQSQVYLPDFLAAAVCVCVSAGTVYIHMHLKFWNTSQVHLCSIAVGNRFICIEICPLEVPKRRAITSLTVCLSPGWICEWGTWPPLALTLECYSGCEYEILPLKVERVNPSPGLLKAACVNPSRPSLKAACEDLR